MPLLAALSVVAAPGPRGMTVRWFPHSPNAPLVATVVRIDPDGKREPPVRVERPAAASAFNADVDKRGVGFFANAGGVDVALMRGTAYVDAGALAGRRYQYAVTLSDGESGLSPISPPAGTRPPLNDYRVTMLSARTGDRRVVLTMQSATHHGNFNVYRSAGAAFARIAQVIGYEKGSEYDDAAAPLHRRIAYRVTVVDAFDNEGPPSQIVYGIARDLHRAPAPRNLRVRAMGNALLVSWDASPDASIGGYDVFRAEPPHAYVRIAQLGAQARRFADRVTPATKYVYDVRARSVDGVDGYTTGGAASFLPKTTPPDAPSGLAAKPSRDAVALSWNPSRDPATQDYEVYRRAPKAQAFLLKIVPVARRSYSDRLPMDARANYEYGVGAVDRFGNRAMPSKWVAARPVRTTIAQAAAPIGVTYAGGAVTIAMVPIVDEDVIAQRVLRADDGHALRALASLHVDQTRYVDRSVRAGHRYAYALATIERGGMQGAVSKTLGVFIPIPVASGPAPQVRLLADKRTVELHWPRASGLLGYQLVRRNPDGSRVVVEPLLRAFAYRDPLPKGARGRYAYALREIAPTGAGALGHFTWIEVH